MKHASVQADAILLLAAALWGAAFAAQRSAMTHIGPLTYNGIRFTLGTLALLIVAAGRKGLLEISHEAGAAAGATTTWRAHLVGGIAAGLVLFAAAALQQAGMVYTTAGKAGFITGLYVPLVPILGLAVGERTRGGTWLGAALAVAGLYLLSMAGSLHINHGDTLVSICALVYAVHVLLVGKIAPNADPLKLAIVQFTVVAIASCATALGIAHLQAIQLPDWPTLARLMAAMAPERVTAASARAALWPILYGGLVSVAIAYTLQLVGQRHAPPAHAAIVLSLETVFAAGTGYLLLSERFGGRELLGAGLMLGGMLFSQVGRLFSPTPRDDLEPAPAGFPVISEDSTGDAGGTGGPSSPQAKVGSR